MKCLILSVPCILVWLFSNHIFSHSLEDIKPPKYICSLGYFVLEEDCDSCGCSANGGSMGFAPIVENNFIGIRFMNQSYQTNDMLYSNSIWHKETFNTTQIWTRIRLFNRFNVVALIPYHWHHREMDNQSITGLGDMTCITFYDLYLPKAYQKWENTVSLGVGIKLPTGKYDLGLSGVYNMNPSFQLGTGSLDYVAIFEHTIQRGVWGMNNMFNYLLKTENDKGYKFGNQWNYRATFYYNYLYSGWKVLPKLGLAIENYDTNFQHGQALRNTSGSIISSNIGLDIGKKRFFISTEVSLPINQNLMGGRVRLNSRWQLSLNYIL